MARVSYFTEELGLTPSSGPEKMANNQKTFPATNLKSKPKTTKATHKHVPSASCLQCIPGAAPETTLSGLRRLLHSHKHSVYDTPKAQEVSEADLQRQAQRNYQEYIFGITADNSMGTISSIRRTAAFATAAIPYGKTENKRPTANYKPARPTSASSSTDSRAPNVATLWAQAYYDCDDDEQENDVNERINRHIHNYLVSVAAN